MTDRDELLRQALSLSREARAELVMQLIASLDSRADEEPEAVWLRHVRAARGEGEPADERRAGERVTPLF